MLNAGKQKSILFSSNVPNLPPPKNKTEKFSFIYTKFPIITESQNLTGINVHLMPKTVDASYVISSV